MIKTSALALTEHNLNSTLVLWTLHHQATGFIRNTVEALNVLAQKKHLVGLNLFYLCSHFKMFSTLQKIVLNRDRLISIGCCH